MRYFKDFIYGIVVLLLFFIIPAVASDGNFGFPFADFLGKYLSKTENSLFILGLIYACFFSILYSLILRKNIKSFTSFFLGFYITYSILILLVFRSIADGILNSF